jgi:hypothetical protein
MSYRTLIWIVSEKRGFIQLGGIAVLRAQGNQGDFPDGRLN